MSSAQGKNARGPLAVATVVATTVGACALAFSGCNAESLQPLQQFITQTPVDNGVTVNFCTDPATPVQSHLKYLVILDHSGSNQMNYQMDPSGSGAPFIGGTAPNLTVNISALYATDPTGISRYGNINTKGTLLNFLKNAPANDPTRGYALVDFDQSVATFPTNQLFTSDINTGDAGDFFQHVYNDSGQATGGAPTDGGDTDYVAALGMAYSIIHNDVTQAQACAAQPATASPTANCATPGKQVSSTYVIVFMSDGSPITSVNGIAFNQNTGQYVVTANSAAGVQINLEPEDQVLAQVASILGLQSNSFYVDSINLFTIYYHIANNIDNEAEQYLKDMATVGNGTMYDVLAGTNIDYTRFTPPQKLIKYTLSDLFVTNSSVTWWTDGKLHQDTDMDGLPDDVETALGSDPYNPDSDGNGVSDYVEFVLNGGVPCAAKSAQGFCKKGGAINYRAAGVACNGMTTVAPSPLSPLARPLAGGIAFPDSDFDGVNDCEEMLLNSGGWQNPDANADGIPDGLELKNGIGFQLGTSPAVNTTGVDGTTIYQKIKTSLPANLPLYQILNPQPSVYTLDLQTTSDVQDCYQLKVTNLPQLGNNNTIRVDILEKSELLQGRMIYHTGKKAFATGSSALLFNDWTSPAEQTAGTWSVWP